MSTVPPTLPRANSRKSPKHHSYVAILRWAAPFSTRKNCTNSSKSAGKRMRCLRLSATRWGGLSGHTSHGSTSGEEFDEGFGGDAGGRRMRRLLISRSAHQSSPTIAKLLFWPFPPGSFLGGRLACGVALDCCGNSRNRQPLSVGELETNDVRDVPSELHRVLGRAI